MTKKHLLILALLAIILSSCKKEDKDITNILLNKTWKRAMTDINSSSNPSGSITYYPVLNCEQDDTFKFNADGTLVISRGSNKCDINETTTETVPYSYNKQNKEFFIDGIKYTIAEESDGQVKYFETRPGASGINYLVFLLQ